MEQKTIPSNRIEELDALRGIAALMVVFFHYNLLLGEKSLPIFKLGVTGVDLFFIISGFVIYMSLTKINTGVDFAINRVSRLYPTYWICVSVTFLFFCFHQQEKFNLAYLILYFKNLSMFQFYLQAKNIDESYWTLIIEMLFYLGILLLFYTKLLKYLKAIGVISCIALVLLTQYFFQIRIVEKIVYYIPILQFIPLFLAGITFYEIYNRKEQLIKQYLVLILCLSSQIMLFEFAGKSRYIIGHLEYRIMIMIYFALFTLFVNHKLGFLVSKISVFFGEISYALYLTHAYIAQEIFIPYLVENMKINFWIASFLIVLPLMVLLAWLITNYLEKPLTKGMKNQLKILFNRNNKASQSISI
jgi:peptidoglycan/LPS O-acetylase OafA/YrhL